MVDYKKTNTENKCLSEIKKVVTDSLRTEMVKIFLFGSRARKDGHATSDIDIGILPYAKFNERKLTLLREKIENLNFPYKIEIVNLAETSEDFKKEALKEAVVWKD